MICTPHRAVSWDQMKNGVRGQVARVREMQSLVGKPEGKRPLGRPVRRSKY